jgi:hypothetical protein
LTFAAGETSKVVTFNVSGDTDVENDEGFTVTLSNPSGNAEINTSTATGTIQNQDIDLSIAATSATKDEGDTGTTGFTFTVTRSGDTSGATTVDYAVTGSGGDPANATDFGGSFPSGTVSFAGGESSKIVTIPVVGDTVDEPDEGFTVTLSNPSGNAEISAFTATGTIQKDDIDLDITATNANRTEQDTGTTAFTFTVVRAGDTVGSTTVDYAVTGSGGDPANGADFGGSLPAGTVSFGAGETSKVVTVNVSGDTDVENDESFAVTLSNPSGNAEINTGTATGTIANNDIDLAITATGARGAEGDGGTRDFTFTVTRTGDTSGTTTVDYAFLEGVGSTAVASDFGGVLPSGTVTFSAGETSKIITAQVKGDSLVEPHERFTIALSNPSGNAEVSTATAIGHILNDDFDESLVNLAGLLESVAKDRERFLSFNPPAVEPGSGFADAFAAFRRAEDRFRLEEGMERAFSGLDRTQPLRGDDADFDPDFLETLFASVTNLGMSLFR